MFGLKRFLGITILSFLFVPVLSSGFDKSQVFFPLQLPKTAAELAGSWAMSLDVGYLDVESKEGIVNLVEPGHPNLKPGELMLIKDQVRIEKIRKLASLNEKDDFLLLSNSGATAIAQINGFAFFRPGQGPTLTLGLIKSSSDAAFPEGIWELALKDASEEKKQKVKVFKVEEFSGEPCPQLFEKCRSTRPEDKTFENACKKIDALGKTLYIAGYWRKPSEPEFDVEDMKIESCFAEKKDLAGSFKMAEGIFPESAFGFSGKDDFFLLGRGGSGAEVCKNLLQYKSGQISLVKQGLCLGY
jgi:hypothetical protein